MKKKQFKAESKKLLDLMINSIYTNKEIFLRELISNASDALDKLYYKSLTDSKIKLKKKDLQIDLSINKEERTITITDNGCGMTEKELEENLGTIAKSGSELFKENNDPKKNIEIIGQFGVGFYSAFMVSDKVEVISKSLDENEAHIWTSNGIDGYSINEYDKNEIGTSIKLHLKENTESDTYDEFLEYYTLERLIKKYSDYIHYPIIMEKETDGKIEKNTLNSMIPIWRKKQKDVKEGEYNDFYTDKFYDYEEPLKVIKSEVEGLTTYQSLLFIPSHTPYDFYTKEYEKGLKLYSKGVLIQDKCPELLPDYYNFVKGIVDSEDLALNISRETLQQNHQLKLIAKSLETKITKELKNLLKEEREKYEKFFDNFGASIKYGIYSSYGTNKEKLEDLLLFKTSRGGYKTLEEYLNAMKEEQEKIYYASGETTDKISLLPQVETVLNKGYEVLYLTEAIDEFTLKSMVNYHEKEFVNVSSEDLDLTTEEEKQELIKSNDDNKEMLLKIKESISGVDEVKFTNKLTNHPVCLISKGNISIEMEKVLNSMPNNENIQANTIMEININHPIVEKLKDLHKNKKYEELEKYSKILYSQARLIEGLTLENPTEISNLVCEILANK